MTTLKAGYDVRYFTQGSCAGGCAGAMSYYTASGEPPGQWSGKATTALSLSDEVDSHVIENLYMEGIGPGGERLLRPRVPRPVRVRETAAVAAYLAGHPFASATELAEARAAERAKEAAMRVPYYDLTISAAKSVSVLHASLKVAAKQARDGGDEETAGALDAEADGIEADLVAAARLAVEQLEREACYTRTGHHSATTGQWRDGEGLIAALFAYHISRDGDPPRVVRGEHAQAAEPAPAHELRAVTLAEAEAKTRAAAPDVDEAARAEAAALAGILSGQRTEMETVQAEYDRWSAETAGVRESASQAGAELERRQSHNVYEPEVINTPEPETPELEPEPEAMPEADMNEPEAADLGL
jgi:hypothetical protein